MNYNQCDLLPLNFGTTFDDIHNNEILSLVFEQASWIRRRDYHLLTVGMGTYSNDDRFMVSHNRPAQVKAILYN